MPNTCLAGKRTFGLCPSLIRIREVELLLPTCYNPDINQPSLLQWLYIFSTDKLKDELKVMFSLTLSQNLKIREKLGIILPRRTSEKTKQSFLSQGYPWPSLELAT